MFTLTAKSKDFYLNILKIFSVRDDDSIDAGVKSYCKAEYGKDWYWAYNSYKTDGKFPSTIISKIHKGIH